MKLEPARPAGDIRMDLIARTVTRGEREIDPQPREFQLLEYFLRNAGKVIPRKMPLEHVWSYDFDPRTNIVETHVSRLRSKLDGNSREGAIRALRDSGYIPRAARWRRCCESLNVRAEGEYERSMFLPRDPDLVLVDSAIAAKMAAERGALTQAVVNIIEANTLLSGHGFENCGVSGAHGLHDGLTALAPTHAYLHGEKVAFGALRLLTPEGRALTKIEETARFCRALGLPTRLADIGLAAVTRADLDRVAAKALEPDSAVWRSSAPLSVAALSEAVVALDHLTTRMFADWPGALERLERFRFDGRAERERATASGAPE